MPSPFVVAAVGLAVAGLASAASQQFRAYGSGKPSYLSIFEGRLWLAAIVVAITIVGSSALLTFLSDGSARTFWTILACCAALSVAMTWWLVRARR